MEACATSSLRSQTGSVAQRTRYLAEPKKSKYASREYARGPDPFKWPEEMRDAALHDRAYGFDDSAAYARIRAAMVPEGRETTETFLTHREEIFAAFGSHLWPDEGEAVRRKRMKATTNAYGMDAGAGIWERRFGNPHGRTLYRHLLAITSRRTGLCTA